MKSLSTEGGSFMMTFTELLKNRRAIRDFQDKDVPLKIVEEILQESTLAPSASNGQPCRFSIVNCRKTLKGYMTIDFLCQSNSGRKALSAFT